MSASPLGGSLSPLSSQSDPEISTNSNSLSSSSLNIKMVQITSAPKPWNGGGGGAARVWKPEITVKDTEMNKFHSGSQMGGQGQNGTSPFKVSLEHNNSTIPPKGFNSSALPFNTDPRVKHLQYNSPLGLYSDSSAAEQYTQQTAGVVSGGNASAGSRSDQPAYLRSETLRLLKEQEGQNGYSSSLSSHPNPQGLPMCYVCTRPILGVMAKAAGHMLHGDCLSCATCGSSLKNIGHHFLEGKFYCDIHGRTKRGTSVGGGLDPNMAVRSTPSAAQPIRPTENVRGYYQPDMMSRRPLSVSPHPQEYSTQSHSVNVSMTTPRTQGAISPSSRGVPSSQMYGSDLARSTSRAPSSIPSADFRPVTVSNPPPPPSNPPPGESRVPQSLRSAVSPRRRAKLPREWPPPKSLPTHTYWNIAPHHQTHQSIRDIGTLAEFVHEMDENIDKEMEKRPKKLTIIERSPSGTKTITRTPSINKQDIVDSHGTDERHRTQIVIGDKSPQALPRRKVPEMKSTISSTISHSRQNSQPIQKNSIKSENIPSHLPQLHPPIVSTVKECVLAPNTQNIPSDSTVPSQSTVLNQQSTPFTLPILHSQLPSVQSVPPQTSSFTAVPQSSVPLSTLPTWGNRPSEAIHKTDAVTEVYRDISESSDPSSISEKQPKTSESTVNANTKEKKLQKKPGRGDARRLTAIYNPNGNGEKKTPEIMVSEDMNCHGRQIARAVSPRPFVRPPTPPRDYPMSPKENEGKSTVTVTKTVDLTSKSNVLGVNITARPFNTPEPSAFPSMRKQLNSERREEQTVREIFHDEHMVDTPSRPTSLSSQQLMTRGKRESTVQGERKQKQRKKEEWKYASEIVDESDIMTDTSRRSDEDSTAAPPSEMSSEYAVVDYGTKGATLRPDTYDVDESELMNIRKNQDDTDIDSEEEKERWMREELEIARKEELGRQYVGVRDSRQREEQRDEMSESDDWRRQAMQLLEDDTQLDKDMELVSRLNQQLLECRQLEDTDRQRAIDCMQKHQRTLEHKQDKLARLLDSAINYVMNMDDAMENLQPEYSIQEPPVPPVRKHYGTIEQHPSNPNSERERDILQELYQCTVETGAQPIGGIQQRGPMIPDIDYPISPEVPTNIGSALHTEQLSHVLEELNHIMTPKSADFITRKIQNVQEKERTQANNYSRSMYEKQNDTTTQSQTGALQQQTTGGKTPYCEACRQQIRGAFVLAQGLSWCPEHFICANQSCARRLLECGFVEENGQKYCEECFENNIAPRCAKCTKPIVSDCLNALQKKWHPQCFTCAHCSKPFGNSAFYLEQGLPYCEADWNRLFTTKCYQCTYPIEAGDRWVEALGHAYHSNCFSCTRCNVNLEGESFYAKNGEPFCKQHA